MVLLSVLLTTDGILLALRNLVTAPLVERGMEDLPALLDRMLIDLLQHSLFLD
jgi:hypothetical protein